MKVSLSISQPIDLLPNFFATSRIVPNPENGSTTKSFFSVKSLINSYFDLEVIDAINAMTKMENEDYFLDYLPRLKKNKIALKVKIADSSHNLSKAHLIEDHTYQEKLRQKYIKVLNFLGVDGSKQEKEIIFDENKTKWVEKS